MRAFSISSRGPPAAAAQFAQHGAVFTAGAGCTARCGQRRTEPPGDLSMLSESSLRPCGGKLIDYVFIFGRVHQIRYAVHVRSRIRAFHAVDERLLAYYHA